MKCVVDSKPGIHLGIFCKKNIAIWYTLLLEIAALSLTSNVLNYEISSVVFQIELCQRCKQLNSTKENIRNCLKVMTRGELG